MISTTAITGDPAVAEAYNRLVREKWRLREKFDEHLPRGKYGSDLDLILLTFYVEGAHPWFKMPGQICLGRYSKKERAISVDIPMAKALSDAVLNDRNAEAEQFIRNVLQESYRLLTSRKALRSLDFDFQQFDVDYKALLANLH